MGWALCDGTNGTPDLEDRFVVGSGQTFFPGEVGGSTEHSHTFLLPQSSSGSGTSPNNAKVGDYTTDPTSSLPPYYALSYIMKL
jgi:hypothetical protein